MEPRVDPRVSRRKAQGGGAPLSTAEVAATATFTAVPPQTRTQGVGPTPPSQDVVRLLYTCLGCWLWLIACLPV